jgi:hypothetical protein
LLDCTAKGVKISIALAHIQCPHVFILVATPT